MIPAECWAPRARPRASLLHMTASACNRRSNVVHRFVDWLRNRCQRAFGNPARVQPAAPPQVPGLAHEPPITGEGLPARFRPWRTSERTVTSATGCTPLRGLVGNLEELNPWGRSCLVTGKCHHWGGAVMGGGMWVSVEPVAVGALASSALGALGWIGWRSRRLSIPSMCPFRLAETYLKGRAETAHEQERRATIVATVTALPPGASLVDRRADGATLTIRIPLTSDGEPATGERRRAA